jgi:hypothetical protein
VGSDEEATSSLPWIGAIPPCPPAISQAGSLHDSVSNGASLGDDVTIRPVGLTGTLTMSRAGCQARMGSS